MKRKLLFILTFSTTCFYLSNAQTAYYDAYALKADVQMSVKQVHQPDGTIKNDTTYSLNDDALKILQAYTDSAGTGIPYNQISRVSAAFATNPFIRSYLVGRAASPNFLSGLITSAGNANVTSFADALAKLIVSRVKADLNTYFFQKFQTFLNQKCPELKVLFPNTSLLLNNFASTDYSNILNTLREAFDKDLHSILADIPNLATLKPADYSDPKVVRRISDFQTKFLNTNDGIIFLSAVTIGNGFITSQKFADILDGVNKKYFIHWTDPNIRSTIDLITVLSSSVRSNKTTVNYLPWDSLTTLQSDPLAFNFYEGLIWQQFHNRNDQIGSLRLDTLVKNNFAGALQYIKQLIENGTDFSTAVNNLLAAKKKGETDLSSYYGAIFESANQLLTVAANIQIVNGNFTFPKPLQNIFSYSADITDLAHDIAIKNYNAALVSLQKFTNDIVAQGSNPALDTAIQHFMKYASFAANVVLAKTTDDVQNAIDAIALPASSAVTQRNTNFNISINAYAGGFAGWEVMPALKKGPQSFSMGVTAPVGFAITIGNLGRSKNLKNPNGKSLTLFIPVIDIGALAAFRFQNDSANIASNVQLQNILAPGAYLYFGFGKCPLSLGFGGQIGPQLRTVTATDVNTSKNYYIRYGFNLLFDIPLFNLVTRNAPLSH